jgi:hypothetical protein
MKKVCVNVSGLCVERCLLAMMRYAAYEVGLNYIPTQIISERLRHGGLHGMAYKSLLAQGGINVVLFDIKDADPINFMLYEAEKISYSFEQRDNPYFAKKSVSEEVPVEPAAAPQTPEDSAG